MKKLAYILLLLIISCNPKDCFKSTGTITQKEITLDVFTRIKVGNEVSLILKQGLEQKVILETGKNLIDDVTVEVIDGRLLMKDENSCNLTRDYAVTKVYVTSPNITEIRSDTSRTIISEGVLAFNDLTIYSEDFHEETIVIGDFDLNINTNNFRIVSNGSSLFKINGNTNNFTITFAAGNARLESQHLIANNILLNHKSTNDMLVNPQLKIEGTIYNLGDVISYNQPEIINVTSLYSGQLIFN